MPLMIKKTNNKHPGSSRPLLSTVAARIRTNSPEYEAK